MRSFFQAVYLNVCIVIEPIRSQDIDYNDIGLQSCGSLAKHEHVTTLLRGLSRLKLVRATVLELERRQQKLAEQQYKWHR